MFLRQFLNPKNSGVALLPKAFLNRYDSFLVSVEHATKSPFEVDVRVNYRNLADIRQWRTVRGSANIVGAEREHDQTPGSVDSADAPASERTAVNHFRIIVEGVWKRRSTIKLGRAEFQGPWKSTPFRWVLLVRNETTILDFRLSSHPVLVAINAVRKSDGLLHGQLVFNRFFPIKNLVFDPNRLPTLFDVEPTPGLFLTGEIRAEI
jgi:hypothetical protein